MLAIVLLTTGGAVFYALSTPDEYTGQALVQFRPRATKNGGIVGNETAASSAAGYAAFLGAPSTIQAVAAQIGVRPSLLRDGLALQVIPATTTLSIALTSGAADLSAQGANAMAQVAEARATDDPVVAATVLAPAGVPGAPSAPQRALIVVAGVILGLLLAAATYFMAQAIGRSRAARRQTMAEPGPPTEPGAPTEPEIADPFDHRPSAAVPVDVGPRA